MYRALFQKVAPASLKICIFESGGIQLRMTFPSFD